MNTDFLSNLTGTIQLGLLVEGEVVPVIIGTVKEVKVLLQGETIEYTVALSTGANNLSEAETNFVAALDLINKEKEKAGEPPV